jgi:hypothetical protein
MKMSEYFALISPSTSAVLFCDSNDKSLEEEKVEVKNHLCC